MGVAYLRSASAPDTDVIIADRHLYLDASESTVVEEGDARSAFQFVARGHPISLTDADRLGLSVDAAGAVVLAGAVVAPVPEPTPVEPTTRKKKG